MVALRCALAYVEAHQATGLHQHTLLSITALTPQRRNGHKSGRFVGFKSALRLTNFAVEICLWWRWMMDLTQGCITVGQNCSYKGEIELAPDTTKLPIFGQMLVVIA